jgi:polar amino acid transport system substrate-binding protein
MPEEDAMLRIRAITTLAAVVVLGACTPAASTQPSASPVAVASEAATEGPSTAPATPNACAANSLQTLAAGKLTIGSDNPAYPPYFEPDQPAASGSPWELGDPTNGQGLEAATAYAVADHLGFSRSNVTWVAVPFNNAIQPGQKDFDLYLQEVSYSADRAQAVDLSDGYFDLNQAVVGLQSDPIAQVHDVAGLKAFKLGAPVGTTSYTYITDNIKPTQDPMVYDTLDAAIAALNAHQIDGVVVDLPTAFYMRDAQLTGGVIVGSLPTVGNVEHFSIVLTKGSPLTACVNQALAAMKADGTLANIVQQWITSQGAPELK